MGKTTGFLEFPRTELPQRDPRARIGDWDPTSGGGLPAAQLREQASRCMDCGVAFCHSTTALPGVLTGCPLHNLIPEWNDLVYRDRWHDALRRLERTNPFPEFTGAICPAPCESACVLGIGADPVSIKAIEWSIAERGFAEGWIRPQPPARRSGRRVAVVGSGPAGLAAAAELNRLGHQVVVFEREDRIGGLLMYGVPEMKLPKSAVDRRVALLVEEGIEFRTGVEVGADSAGPDLVADFDAVVLATGATRPRDLRIPGRPLEGIRFAMDYLTEATRAHLEDRSAEESLSAQGRDVVVIGGGDTATDALATALRQGCRSATLLEITPEPPEDRGPGDPWPRFPRVLRFEYGHEEAVERFGQDPRRFSAETVEFLAGEGRGVGGVRIRNTAVPEDPGASMVLPAELVILAIGFTGPETEWTSAIGVSLTESGTFRTEASGFATARPGVFAAGDCRRGQSLVVWAIAEGRDAAREADRYLSSLPRG